MNKLGFFVLCWFCLLQIFQLFSVQDNARSCLCCLFFWKKKTKKISDELEEMIVMPSIPTLLIPRPPSIESVHTLAPQSRSKDSLESFVQVAYDQGLNVDDGNDFQIHSPRGMARTGSYVSSTTAEIQHSSGTFRKSMSVEMNNDLLLTDQGWLSIEPNDP